MSYNSYHQYKVLCGKRVHSQFHVGATYILTFGTPMLQSLPIMATPIQYGFHYLHDDYIIEHEYNHYDYIHVQ